MFHETFQLVGLRGGPDHHRGDVLDVRCRSGIDGAAAGGGVGWGPVANPPEMTIWDNN